MDNRPIKVYADTSVFGGVFDPEFSAPSRKFFGEVDAGGFSLVTSPVVEEEIGSAPEAVQDLFAAYYDILRGHGQIGIHSPLEVVQHDSP